MTTTTDTEMRQSRTETLESPERIPLYRLVPLHGPDGESIEAYRGVQREDTNEVVSVVSNRYSLLQHRQVAEAVHSIGAALDLPDSRSLVAGGNARFPWEQIRLYANGRRMEVKLVIGQKYKLDGANEFYPAIRVFNSLDGAWALKLENFALRLACTNQLYAGARSFLEFRELHLSSAEDMLGQLQKAVYQVLDHFDDALGMYSGAMSQEIPIRDFVPALVESGIPRRHVDRMADGLPEYYGSAMWGTLSRWDAYQLSTDYLTHQVQVNPERERHFERAAARALLLTSQGEGGEAVLV